jgi:hypothetical protein
MYSRAENNNNNRYSWSYGPVHFVTSNSETDFPKAPEGETGDAHLPWLRAGGFGEDGEYLAWLEADLKARARARCAQMRSAHASARACAHACKHANAPHGRTRTHARPCPNGRVFLSGESTLQAASEARANSTGRPWLVVGGHRPYNELPQDAIQLIIRCVVCRCELGELLHGTGKGRALKPRALIRQCDQFAPAR